MDGKKFPKGYHVGRVQQGWKQKPWSHDELNVLQLDMFDRTVVKIAGEHENLRKIPPWNHRRQPWALNCFVLFLRDKHTTCNSPEKPN
jgi:hypothetical protein